MSARVRWFHVFHRWSRWSDVVERESTRLPKLGAESSMVGPFSDGLIHETEYIQRRVCFHCGAEQVRLV